LLRYEALEAQRQVLYHSAAEVAACRRAALVAEDVVDERVQVARVPGEVVEAVGRQAGVPEPAQVGDDHLEPYGRERRDVAGPDPLGLRPAVHEQQWEPGPVRRRRAPVRDLHSGADLGALD